MVLRKQFHGFLTKHIGGNIMQDNRFSCGPGIGKETVCIETNRILDSCRDRDCFENARVFLTDFGKEIIDHTSTVRVKSACIAQTQINLDPVQFNRGFYSVNIRFYVKLVFEACIGNGRSQEFEGIAVLDKRVILYGGDCNVSTFRSDGYNSDFCAQVKPCCKEKNVPTATVEVAEPIVLGVNILETVNDCCCCCCCANDIPESVVSTMNGNLYYDDDNDRRYLAVSIGIFSIVRIVRTAQLLVTATEYVIPDKECLSPSNDDPCSVFRSMAFPISEFSCTGCTPPQGLHDKGNGNKCGC
jgi:hypothetical protein